MSARLSVRVTRPRVCATAGESDRPMQNIWSERQRTIPNLLQRRLQDGPPSAFTWKQMLLSLLPAGGLEGGTLKLEKCGFGPSSHSAPSFFVS